MIFPTLPLMSVFPSGQCFCLYLVETQCHSFIQSWPKIAVCPCWEVFFQTSGDEKVCLARLRVVSKQHGGEGMMIPFTPLPTLHRARAGLTSTVPARVRLCGRTRVTAPFAPDTWFSGQSHMNTNRKTKEGGLFFFFFQGATFSDCPWKVP